MSQIEESVQLLDLISKHIPGDLKKAEKELPLFIKSWSPRWHVRTSERYPQIIEEYNDQVAILGKKERKKGKEEQS